MLWYKKSVARWWFIVISSSWYPKHLKKLMNLLRAPFKWIVCVLCIYWWNEPRKWWISIAAPVLVSQDNAEWFFIVILDARLCCVVDSVYIHCCIVYSSTVRVSMLHDELSRIPLHNLCVGWNINRPMWLINPYFVTDSSYHTHCCIVYCPFAMVLYWWLFRF